MKSPASASIVLFEWSNVVVIDLIEMEISILS